MHGQQIVFERYQIHRQVIHPLADHDELGASSLLAVVSQLQCHFSWISKQLEFPLPLALDLFADRCAPLKWFHLWWTRLFQLERRGVAGLRKFTGQFIWLAEMGLKGQIQSPARLAFGRETGIGTVNDHILKGKSLGIQPGNGNRAGPGAVSVRGEVHYYSELVTRNL